MILMIRLIVVVALGRQMVILGYFVELLDSFVVLLDSFVVLLVIEVEATPAAAAPPGVVATSTPRHALNVYLMTLQRLQLFERLLQSMSTLVYDCQRLCAGVRDTR